MTTTAFILSHDIDEVASFIVELTERTPARDRSIAMFNCRSRAQVSRPRHRSASRRARDRGDNLEGNAVTNNQFCSFTTQSNLVSRKAGCRTCCR
jgi:hypothetical protein